MIAMGWRSAGIADARLRARERERALTCCTVIFRNTILPKPIEEASVQLQPLYIGGRRAFSLTFAKMIWLT